MRKTLRVFLYFSCWIFIALICVVLNIINVDWSRTDTVNGIVIVVVLGVLQGSVLEFPVQTIATLVIGGERRSTKRAVCDRLTVILNYNLLATGKDDILECIETMYMAFVGNLSPNVSAVLVSATNDDDLKEYELQIRDTYRAILYDDLYREGLAFAKGEYDLVDPIHLHNVWAMYVDIDRETFISEYLEDICDRYAREFMVVHRVSRVLRKCGQYQDLMLLSEGEFEAYSYCDSECYGKSARERGEPLFHSSEDVSNILERKFDYTLVLDADTGVPRGGVFDMMQIAAAYPERGIIQPSIKLHCAPDDTMFMHLESMRQAIYEPMTNALTALFDQSSYFGKALIKNRLYIDFVIGCKENLIERVPVDVLSHDTFEAALLRPLYAGSTYLLEAPSHNYVTWNIRERRWNRGELILAMYFWKNGFGVPMRWLQKKLQKSKYNKTKVRTESKLDFVTSYIAHSALRQMLMKPALLLYILLHINVHLRYRYASIIIVMFSVLIFPKFATCNRENYKFVILETVASMLQFTPEALVGCVRIWRALYANVSLNVKWIPQRAVEEEFKMSNPFVSSFKHLWGYSLFAVITGILVMLFLERAMLVLVMLVTLVLLPLYTGFTSLSPGFKCCKPKMSKLRDVCRDSITKNSWQTDDNGVTTISSGNTYRSLGKLDISSKYAESSIFSTSEQSSTPLVDSILKLDEKGTSKSWSLEVENLINEKMPIKHTWPLHVRNRHFRNSLLSSRTYTTYDYCASKDDKYVTIINVTSSDSKQNKSVKEKHINPRDDIADINVELGTPDNVYDTLRNKANGDYENLRSLRYRKNQYIWSENNVTYIMVGNYRNSWNVPNMMYVKETPDSEKGDTKKVTVLNIRRNLKGRTYLFESDSETSSLGGSVEKLYQNIGVLKGYAQS
ncbi:hypothetical protein ACF0H5_009460 [Mactra antiquata]